MKQAIKVNADENVESVASKHPELQEGEIFLWNFSTTSTTRYQLFRSLSRWIEGRDNRSWWSRIERKSKRLWVTAYDIHGNPVVIEKIFPVFVQASEIQDAYRQAIKEWDKIGVKRHKSTLEKAWYKIEESEITKD